MDDYRHRRVADDIESQSTRPMPREVHVGTLIAALVAVALTAILIWVL